MTAISSTTNHQIHLDDHKPFMPSSSSSSSLMEKTNQDPPPPPPPPPHHQSLKCPRCDSSNTKFCYYNNYSLSQPRHFCKACKRYWTRGGTLRNVPVGGGCRKNKRPKRVSSSGGGDGASSAVSAAATANPSGQLPHIDLSNRMHNPLFYNPVELNFPFSSYSSARVSSDTFDLHSQMNGLGLGFSSGLHEGGYKNGFRPIQDVISNSTSSSSPFSAAGGTNNNSNNSNIFFGSSSSTMASLLASSLHQQKFGDIQDPKSAPGFMPYEDPSQQMKPERENGSVWNPNPDLNPIEQINSSDPSSLLWNTLFDPSNLGSSVPSLI